MECLQILNCLKTGPYQTTIWVSKGEKDKWKPCDEQGYNNLQSHLKRKTPWYNHPVVKMWAGHEQSLIDYGLAICDERSKREYKDNCGYKIFGCWLDFPHIFEKPEFLGNEKFHLAMRSNLVRKFPEHYRIFWPDVPDNLPYIWKV